VRSANTLVPVRLFRVGALVAGSREWLSFARGLLLSVDERDDEAGDVRVAADIARLDLEHVASVRDLSPNLWSIKHRHALEYGQRAVQRSQLHRARPRASWCESWPRPSASAVSSPLGGKVAGRCTVGPGMGEHGLQVRNGIAEAARTYTRHGGFVFGIRQEYSRAIR
jgi:hypothetical protein